MLGKLPVLGLVGWFVVLGFDPWFESPYKTFTSDCSTPYRLFYGD